jgi:hypothetical protein
MGQSKNPLKARRELDADPLIGKLAHRIAQDNSFILHTDSDSADDLIASVAVACAHARSMVDELGEPFALSLKQNTETALGPVLFDSRQDAMTALRQASKIKEVFTSSATRECVFILTMQRHEYHVFGSEIEGDLIKRDVMQQVVEFGDHHFTHAAGSLQELGDKLVENVVLYLAGLAPQRMKANEKMRAEILRSEELLKAQLKTLQHALMEHRPFAAPSRLQGKLAQGGQELAGLEGRLSTLTVNHDTHLCLGEIRDILLAPERHIHLESIEMRVGDFGVKSATGKLVRFHECCYDDGKRLAVFLASITRELARNIWPELD